MRKLLSVFAMCAASASVAAGVSACNFLDDDGGTKRKTGVEIGEMAPRAEVEGSELSDEVRVVVYNYNDEPVNWIRFEFEFYNRDIDKVIFEGTFECGSRFGSAMTIAPRTAFPTPWVPMEIPMGFFDPGTKDIYGWRIVGEVEYGAAE